MAQSVLNVAAALGCISGPLIVSALEQRNPNGGWRNYFWIQMAMWGFGAFGTVVGYRPLNRHNRLENLPLQEKLKHLDLAGCGILLAGLTLFLVGLNLGGGLYDWTNARVITTLVIGGVLLICFELYEWKGTRVGITHHDMFSIGKTVARNLSICFGLMCGEAILLFSILIFYPVM
jgi:MFS family permease